MSGSNLPDDVTPANIDAHYAEPDDTLVSGAVDVGVDVRVPGWMDRDEMEQALADAVRECCDFEDDRMVEVADVRIGEVVKR